ncbi:amphi-Trp domain-containing protein [Desulfonatronospira sp.]|nr:amphi-Trp domain-containing protein [Desulfonatronospira sp.]
MATQDYNIHSKPREECMGKDELKFKAVVEKQSLIATLENLMDSIQVGRLYVGDGQQGILLVPAPHLKLEIRAESKKDKEKICMEISWRTDSKEFAFKEPELVISSQAPEITYESEAGDADQEYQESNEQTEEELR